MIGITSDDPEVNKMLEDMKVEGLSEHLVHEMMKTIFTESFDSHLLAMWEDHLKGATEIYDAIYVPQLKRHTKISVNKMYACLTTAMMHEVCRRWAKLNHNK